MRGRAPWIAVQQQTAYLGAGHVAELVACPTCQVPARAACVSTVHMIGTCVADGMKVSGLHAARVVLGVERWGVERHNMPLSEHHHTS